MNQGKNIHIYGFRSGEITFHDTAIYTDLWVQNEPYAFIIGYKNPFSQLNLKETQNPSTEKSQDFYFRFFYLPEG